MLAGHQQTPRQSGSIGQLRPSKGLNQYLTAFKCSQSQHKDIVLLLKPDLSSFDIPLVALIEYHLSFSGAEKEERLQL